VPFVDHTERNPDGGHHHQKLVTMERRALATALRNARPFFLIAGPCVIESEEIVMDVAKRCVS
jgi:3-deoxy-D-manno-octulosonic acid (KDO) 8-phosphate synthase